MLQFPRWRVDVTVDGRVVKTFHETATSSAAAIGKAKHKMRGAVSSAGAFKFKATKVEADPLEESHATKKSSAQLQREINEVLAGKAVTSSLTPAQRAYVSLFEQDVRKHPEAYKEMVRADPAAYALQVISGLDDEDVRQFTRDLRAEMRLVARHTSHSTKKTALRWNPAVRGRGEVTARSGYRAFVQPVSAGKWRWEVKPVGYEMLDPERAIGTGTATSKVAAKAAASRLLLSQLS